MQKKSYIYLTICDRFLISFWWICLEENINLVPTYVVLNYYSYYGGMGTWNAIFWYISQNGMGSMQIEQDFSSFFAIFDEFSNFWVLPKHLWCIPLWKIIKYGQKMKTSLGLTCLQPISPWRNTAGISVSGTRSTTNYYLLCIFTHQK